MNVTPQSTPVPRQNEPRVRVEERRLKTEADLNSANPSLFTELPFTRCGKGLSLAVSTTPML